MRTTLKQAFVALALLVLLAPPAAHAAPKTDIVIFHNGDRLTGEVRSLSRAELNLNTDATGTIGIEWDKISKVISNQSMQVEIDTGTRYFGQLVEAAVDGRIVVSTNDGAKELNNDRVVLITPIEERRIDALDVDVSLGYNFTKATGVKQATMGLDADYRTRLRIYSLRSSAVVSDSDEQESSKRASAVIDYKRLWNNRWFTNFNIGLEQNDELGVDLRTTIGGGGGRFLIQNNHTLLTMQGGLLIARENNAGDSDTVDSLEGSFELHWDWFLFDSPELDWSTKLQMFPSLTDIGRLRVNFDTGLQWEIYNDLNWGFTFYSSFDNRPASDDASKSDYGVDTKFTYEF